MCVQWIRSYVKFVIRILGGSVGKILLRDLVQSESNRNAFYIHLNLLCYSPLQTESEEFGGGRQSFYLTRGKTELIWLLCRLYEYF